jgi:hypothetical protein
MREGLSGWSVDVSLDATDRIASLTRSASDRFAAPNGDHASSHSLPCGESRTSMPSPSK